MRDLFLTPTPIIPLPQGETIIRVKYLFFHIYKQKKKSSQHPHHHPEGQQQRCWGVGWCLVPVLGEYILRAILREVSESYNSIIGVM
jgi:hypothetical protein